ncbi:hypothetical protein KW790_01255 [Candidatus Parcubacteria bacterium]|nr:hypothetical protein [Candidatus Parcubacteria bacterium]
MIRKFIPAILPVLLITALVSPALVRAEDGGRGTSTTTQGVKPELKRILEQSKASREELKEQLKENKQDFKVAETKMRVAATVNMLNAAVGRLDSIIGRIETSLASTSAAVGTTTPQGLLNAAKANITDARGHIANIQSLNFSSTTSTTTLKTNFETIRVEARAAKTSIESARKNLLKIVELFRSYFKDQRDQREKHND